MIKQFVDHFKTGEYGFNFFPALGWIFGAMAGQALFLGIFAILNALRENRTIQLEGAVSVFYAVGPALLFVFLCHVVKNDALFPVVFSLSYVLVGIAIRWIAYVSASMGVYFISVMPLARYLFAPLNLAGNFFWALALSLAVVILYKVFKRLDYAILLGFPAAAFVNDVFFAVVSLAKYQKISLEAEFLLFNLIEAFLTGFFLVLGYKLYLRARGLEASGGNIEYLGEEAAPKTRFIPLNAYFGLMLAVVFLGLVLLGFVGRFWNWKNADPYSLGQLSRIPPKLEIDGLIILVLSSVIAVVSLVVSLLFIYKMWSAVQDGKASTTPGLAVGLLFVPVFNLYWAFLVYYGFARDYNALVKRRGLNIPQLPGGLYLAQIILALVVGVSSYLVSGNISVSVVAAFLLMPLGLATFYLTCQAVNRIPPEIYAPVAGGRRP